MDKRQRDLRSEVLTFVAKYLTDNGYGPTCDEIREAIGLSSRSHARYYLDALEQEGFITRKPHSPRSVRLANGSRTSYKGHSHAGRRTFSVFWYGREP